MEARTLCLRQYYIEHESIDSDLKIKSSRSSFNFIYHRLITYICVALLISLNIKGDNAGNNHNHIIYITDLYSTLHDKLMP
jgi:hypothetical protein